MRRRPSLPTSSGSRCSRARIVDIPPRGGDTLFADQYAAHDGLPDDLRERIAGLVGIHSARRGYSKQGQYGDRDVGRSMDIVASDNAMATQRHPLIRLHRESGRPALFCSLAYTIGIEGMDDDDATALPSSSPASSPGRRTPTATTGNRAWSPSWTTVAWSTRPPAATKATAASSTA